MFHFQSNLSSNKIPIFIEVIFFRFKWSKQKFSKSPSKNSWVEVFRWWISKISTSMVWDFLTLISQKLNKNFSRRNFGENRHRIRNRPNEADFELLLLQNPVQKRFGAKRPLQRRLAQIQFEAKFGFEGTFDRRTVQRENRWNFFNGVFEVIDLFCRHVEYFRFGYKRRGGFYRFFG